MTPVAPTVLAHSQSMPKVNRSRVWWTIPVVGAAFACGVAVGYFLLTHPPVPPAVPPSAHVPEVAAVVPSSQPLPDVTVLPAPTPVPSSTAAPTPPASPVSSTPVAVPPAKPPEQVAVAPPPPPERAIRIDPFDAADVKLDAPTGTAEVIALDGNDRLTLTGRVKVLTLNALNGSVQIDASGLEAEEVVLAGDVNGDCRLKLNARNGAVTIRRAFVGSCTLVATAPGGTVTLADGGRIGGGTTVTLTAKTVDARGKIDEGAKVDVTLTGGGGLKVAAMDGGAVLTYRRAGTGDPVPAVEAGDLRGSARLSEVK